MNWYKNRNTNERSGGELPFKKIYRAPAILLGLAGAAFFGKGDTLAKRVLNALAWTGSFALGFFILDESSQIIKRKQDKQTTEHDVSRSSLKADTRSTDHFQCMIKEKEITKEYKISLPRIR